MMVANLSIPSGAARIAMPNLFDFTMYHGFMKSCTPLLNNIAVREIEVELSAVDYLDSFALDMLMLLKERAISANKSLSLISPSIPVTRVLGTHFSEMFNIKHTTVAQTNDCESPCAAVQRKYAGERQNSQPSSWHM